MPKVPIDIILLIRPISPYRFENVAERISKVSLPQFFAARQPGNSLWQSELLLAVVCTPGVRNTRLIRLSRASGSGGVPPEKLDFEPDELPTLGQIEIAEDPTLQTRAPF